MQKSKIEWTDYVWNPIKGLCPVGCWYCYARKIYGRFKLDPTLRIDFVEINAPFPKKPSKIFVCSTMELFSPEVDELKIRDTIFDIIASAPQHTFIILTKLPERIDRPMPDNVWLGVSATTNGEADYRIPALKGASAKIKFVSFEPILERIDPDSWAVAGMAGLRWAIFGRLTGCGRKNDPIHNDIAHIVSVFRAFGIPVFLKDNLCENWGGPMYREFPR